MRVRALVLAVLLGTVLSALPVSARHVTFVDVSAGVSHGCGIDSNRELYCWGDNDWGQLGDGTTLPRTTPTPVLGLPAGPVQDVAASSLFTCAVVAGSAWCWGYGGYGELGHGWTPTRQVTPVAVRAGAGLTPGTVVDVDASERHACAVDSAGAAFCWGRNHEGQLGDGTRVDRTMPVAVAAGAGLTPGTVRSVHAGSGRTCAVSTGGRAFCWGDNSNGELGDGSYVDRTVPSAVAAGAGLTPGTVTQLSIGTYHACAVGQGIAYCWGYQSDGRLGDGTNAPSPVPVMVAIGEGLARGGVRSVHAGGYHACAVDWSGDAFCWGNNDNGQVGDGSIGAGRLAPVRVSDLTGLARGTVTVIEGGNQTTCAVTGARRAYCWGTGTDGQRGDGTLLTSPLPLPVF